ncbi:MAG: DUF2290 domain-containing protein [Cyclobacteriaceae bacterium]|nr:DUF2290 domain-containing protein [Cyclobacteriaceae bacterium]
MDASITLLKEIKLYKGKGPKTIGKYSDDFKKVCRNNRHIEIYNTIRENLDYEILLIDDSFFQFSYDDNYLRFSFIENPNITYTKFEYLKFVFPEYNLDEIPEEEIESLIDENEYEQFINEQEVNSNLIYIRYDYDKRGYRPLLHSCSHIHIGLNENFRIPSSIILTPLEFLMFCIKQRYFYVWKIFHEKFEPGDWLKKRSDSKKLCQVISDSSTWDKIEKNEIYIA